MEQELVTGSVSYLALLTDSDESYIYDTSNDAVLTDLSEGEGPVYIICSEDGQNYMDLLDERGIILRGQIGRIESAERVGKWKPDRIGGC